MGEPLEKPLQGPDVGVVARLGSGGGEDPVAFKRDELIRMDGVVRQFSRIRWQDLTVALLGAGVAVFGVASRRSTWQGVGLSISLQALAVLALEEVDRSRALRYQAQLTRFDPGGNGER